MNTVAVSDPEIEKFCTKRRHSHAKDLRESLEVGGEHARVPIRSHYRSGIQASAGRTGAFLHISLLLQAQRLSTCVSGSCVFPFRFLFNAGGFHSEFS